MKQIFLVTNNKDLSEAVSSGRYIHGSSLDVLTSVRGSVHYGSKLLTHPLCGNLRPYQQPFRSVIIEEDDGAQVDIDSLSIIENAVSVYKACEDRLLKPDDLTPESRMDYAFVDAELMRESLLQFRMLKSDKLLSPAKMRNDGGVFTHAGNKPA